VLYRAEEGDAIQIDLDRGGKPGAATLTLPAGWRGR
jgi:hypothetical protein